ncbi:conserved hypothetical protein (putative transposase or invertase) [Hathewaya proteolytica DSM 3090]|uniref:PD-(D/E)XK nuclease family transposase n=1 Tax=Hathewaya proteolytica DSM 3090 TaxID=1121331 RepID=A0A1M6QZ22_9CLOT|nr:conserved hypothetical protein (putative transposase or invertase) [Hathewaya proteolytica DSM 3090]
MYLNPFNDREIEQDKQSIMDIKVKTEKGELIDIEVQINDVDDYKRRSLYYWAKLYCETLKKSNYYYDLKKSIVINILDFNLIKENNKFHNVFLVKERDDNFAFTEDLEIHYLELNKFEHNKNISELNDLEGWVTFLKECEPNGDTNILTKLSKNKEEIGVAVDIMNKLSADELEYQRYLAREKYLMDEMSKKKYAEYKMNKVKEELEEAEKERDSVKQDLNRAKEEKNRVEEENLKMKEELKNIKATLLLELISEKFKDDANQYRAKVQCASIESIEKAIKSLFTIENIEQLDELL